MIQLASDPNASRMEWRNAQADKGASLQAPGTRSRHAWPFISRYAEKPAAPTEAKKPEDARSS
jgi:hypothetical protein